MTKKTRTSLGASLQPKKELIKKERNIEQIHKNVSELHAPETPKKKQQKFQISLDADLHTKIKIHCATNKIKMQDFMARLIEEKAKELKIV